MLNILQTSWQRSDDIGQTIHTTPVWTEDGNQQAGQPDRWLSFRLGILFLSNMIGQNLLQNFCVEKIWNFETEEV